MGKSGERIYGLAEILRILTLSPRRAAQLLRLELLRAEGAGYTFRDGLDVVAEAGATAVMHPGGSLRDDEVIAAADERGVAMVLTGMRHFRH